MRPIRNPPPNPRQIISPLRILPNPHNQPLPFKTNKQPLHKLFIPRNFPCHINRKNKLRKNRIQIRQNLLRYLLHLLLRNPWHPNKNKIPLIFFVIKKNIKQFYQQKQFTLTPQQKQIKKLPIETLQKRGKEKPITIC